MYNILAYITYLTISSFITLYVGWACHRNGYYYLLEMFKNNQTETKSVNNLLLIGYYLVNIGYIIYTISRWEVVFNLADLMIQVFIKVGTITMLLGILHYMNITLFTVLRNKHLK